MVEQTVGAVLAFEHVGQPGVFGVVLAIQGVDIFFAG